MNEPTTLTDPPITVTLKKRALAAKVEASQGIAIDNLCAQYGITRNAWLKALVTQAIPPSGVATSQLAISAARDAARQGHADLDGRIEHMEHQIHNLKTLRDLMRAAVERPLEE